MTILNLIQVGAGHGFEFALVNLRWITVAVLVLAGCTHKPHLMRAGDRIWHVYCLWLNTYDDSDGHWRLAPFPDDSMPSYPAHEIDDDTVYYDAAAYQKALKTGVDQDAPIKHFFLKHPEMWVDQGYSQNGK